MVGDVCGGRKSDLKTVAPGKNRFRVASLLVRAGCSLIVLLTCM